MSLMATHKEILDHFSYSQETGVFIYRKDIKRVRAGTEAKALHSAGYIQVGFRGKTYLAHRLAWFYMHEEWPEQIDHINHNRADNRIVNLRSVNNAINHRNRPMQANNKSGFTGVSWSKSVNKWTSEIKVSGKKTVLGYFNDKKDAISARKKANLERGFHPNHGAVVNAG